MAEGNGVSCGKFKVSCNAGDTGLLNATSDSVSVRIQQDAGSEGHPQMWESVQVHCKQQDDGSLRVEVVVFHPDWDEALRIASLQSWPCTPSAKPNSLKCDLTHEQF